MSESAQLGPSLEPAVACCAQLLRGGAIAAGLELQMRAKCIERDLIWPNPNYPILNMQVHAPGHAKRGLWV